ncbi:MAG: hypothetical protein ACREL3_09225 [Gemmatimonadales bacterium]
MLRLERWSRCLGAITAAWFAALVLAPNVVHYCPAFAGVAGHAPAGHGHPGHGAPADHGRHQHGCDCPALCCAASVAWAASAPSAPAVKVGQALAVSAVFPPPFAPPVPAHLLPFATAPPAATR